MSEPVDACGLSCPHPVMLTRHALEAASGGRVVVLVDSMAQVRNCTRAASKLGWRTDCVEKPGGVFELTFHK